MLLIKNKFCVVNKSKRSIKKKVCKYCFKLKTFEEDKDYFSKISKILNDLIVFVISNNDFFRPNSTSCLPSPCSLMLVLLIVFLSCSTYKCDLSVLLLLSLVGVSYVRLQVILFYRSILRNTMGLRRWEQQRGC